MLMESKTDFCINCEKETKFTLTKKKIKREIRQKEYEFEITVAICNECGEEMAVPGLLDLNAKEIDEQYRKMEDLITVDEIESLMDIYNIGKAPLSYAMGFGEITITRYLAGQVPSKEYSQIMRLALYYPAIMKKHLEENKEKIGETAYKKSMKATDELVGTFSLSNELVAVISYIFEKMEEVTPLALQKLLYFAQGIFMAQYNRPLFEEDCMAWIHGPVYEKVYDLFRDFKYNPIDDKRFAMIKGRFVNLTEEQKEVVDLVINTFGRYGGKTLEQITHNEEPWQKAREGYSLEEKSREIINKDDIKGYFEKVCKKYDMSSTKGINLYINSISEKI